MSNEVVQANPPTSDATSEVKPRPAAVSAEEKILAGIKQAWLTLKDSDKLWEQTGRQFGKWCSQLRMLKKKQGSHKGLGFEAAVKKLLGKDGIRKARYWADVYDGKINPRYAGGSKVAPKTNDKPKPDGPKPTPFVLPGLTDDQRAAMVRMETDANGFAQFAYKLVTEPGAEQVRFVVNRCLDKLDKLEDQLDLLAELRGWIDRQCFELQEQIEVGNALSPRAIQRRRLNFLDEDDEGTSSSADALTSLINKARKFAASADANTNAPGPTVPPELVVGQQEATEATAGVM